jgi:hypothetical protein
MVPQTCPTDVVEGSKRFCPGSVKIERRDNESDETEIIDGCRDTISSAGHRSPTVSSLICEYSSGNDC